MAVVFLIILCYISIGYQALVWRWWWFNPHLHCQAQSNPTSWGNLCIVGKGEVCVLMAFTPWTSYSHAFFKATLDSPNTCLVLFGQNLCWNVTRRLLKGLGMHWTLVQCHFINSFNNWGRFWGENWKISTKATAYGLPAAVTRDNI